MTETLVLPETSDRATRYHALIPQIQALLQDEDDLIASLANTAAGLFQGLNVLWAGFYLVKHGGLVLGPFQGPIACTRIKLGDGVCGQSWAQRKTIIVDDVDDFPGHIACSAASKSEIVVPIIKQNRVVGVLDIDSIQPKNFSDIDRVALEDLSRILSTKF
ncbi:GAF domain-containing protein [Pseudomonadales bacterium]|jgi:L-methionine (R)-S-oxide reductase|nr:GAF domain-containing protein [Pseudomonadales bacterium]MDB2509295.1 GAF domain-containing protein [Pseudomonadales bacterium]MDC1329818.1 GAF domain-containing protein [Pseudomonadales bacterium]